jgi:hypothetical protein
MENYLLPGPQVPDWGTGVGNMLGIVAGLESDRNNLAEEIQEAVRSINERYAGVHGGDLFKATNKTMAALGVLGKALVSGSSGRCLSRSRT